MIVVFAVAALLIVFVIAAVVIGREARRHGNVPPKPVFDFEEAVEWVCRHVSDDVAPELTPEAVRQIIHWHLEYFHLKGVAPDAHGTREGAPLVVGAAE